MWRLHPEYRENAIQKTWEAGDAGVYWNKERVLLSGHYQYDAYLLGRKLAEENKLQTVLDIGSGPGIKNHELLSDVVRDIALVDQPSVAHLVETHCPKATFYPVDLETCEIELTDRFDLILCIDVIEHLLDPTSCFDFMLAHASPDSLFVISTPERDYLHGVNHFFCNKAEHVREWNGLEFAAVLEDVGFEVVEHWVSPQIRSENERGNSNILLATEFSPADADNNNHAPDAMKACQICICKKADRQTS